MTAQEFACDHHAAINQQYDGHPYSFHLAMVSAYAEKYQHLLPEHMRALALDGAWVHDLIEDCRVTYNDVAKELGGNVAEVSYVLATPKGRNRAERHCAAYYQEIANSRVATFVKICDRLANVAHSATGGNKSMLARYKAEQPKFKAYLDYYNFGPMWDELDSLFAS